VRKGKSDVMKGSSHVALMAAIAAALVAGTSPAAFAHLPEMDHQVAELVQGASRAKRKKRLHDCKHKKP